MKLPFGRATHMVPCCAFVKEIVLITHQYVNCCGIELAQQRDVLSFSQSVG